jgi:hypothetical protein
LNNFKAYPLTPALSPREREEFHPGLWNLIPNQDFEKLLPVQSTFHSVVYN